MTEDAWSEDEWTAFYEMANAFIHKANALSAAELTGEVEIGAAMIYACSRFNTFTMQAQLEDPSQVDGGVVDFLAGEFESHLRDHMEEQVCSTPGAQGDTAGRPGRAVQVLRGLDGRSEDEVSEFLDLADQFLNLANGLVGRAQIGRISSAFMHGSTRFNVYTMQLLGHPPEQIDEALVSDFCGIYADLVRHHASEILIAPQA